MSFSLFYLKFDQYYSFSAHFVSVFDVNNTKNNENYQKSDFWVRGNEFCHFGNEFHRFGNEFSHFGGNEFRPNRTKKKPEQSVKDILALLNLMDDLTLKWDPTGRCQKLADK